MGNSASSSSRAHQDESVDFGSLVPQGVYTGIRDWNQTIVSQLICARRLAPYYRPLEEYDDSWDDDQILAARKELPDSEGNVSETTRPEPAHLIASRSSGTKRTSLLKEPSKPEAAVYRGAVECPICFLYYPPNINHSRCCDQAICTECFVQIKRSEPTTTHLVSDPAACPYCVQENFGVVYTPPPWRAGIGSEGVSSPWSDYSKSSPSIETSPPIPTHKRRQKSFGHDSPEVVTTDQIRPDWEAKLATVRAAVNRRANRRIIMRQVGDRLIPVGVTSGRIHPLTPEEGGQSESDTSGSRRSRRRQQQPQSQALDQFMGSMGLGGQDLEELMIMEAMRLSLIDHEEQQRKEAEEKKKNAASKDADNASPAHDPGESGPSSSENHALTAPSTSSPSSSISSSYIPIPHNESNPHESTTPDRLSFLVSRSGSPSPSPTNGTSSFQAIDDSASRWKHQTPSSPPLGTLGIGISSSSSTAVIGSADGGSVDTPSPTNLATPTVPTLSTLPPITTPEGGIAASVETSAQPVPSITLGDHGTLLNSDSPDMSSNSRPSLPARFDSFTSSVFSTQSNQLGSSYDILPSSPDSIVSHEPLLTPGATTDAATLTKSTVVENEPRDYFGNISSQG